MRKQYYYDMFTNHIGQWLFCMLCASILLQFYLIASVKKSKTEKTGEAPTLREVYSKAWLRGLLVAFPVLWVANLIFFMFHSVGLFEIIFSLQTFILLGMAYIGHFVLSAFLTSVFLKGSSSENAVTRSRGLHDNKLLNILKTQTDGVLLCWLKKNEGDKWLTESPAKRADISERGIVFGTPGTGKTAYLISQAIDWMKSGRPLVMVDVKPEIWGILREKGIFERFGYRDYVFNPTNPKSLKYNLFDEWNGSDSDLLSIINCLMPLERGADNSVFIENGQRLLKAVLLHLPDGKRSLPAARRFIAMAGDSATLLSNLEHSSNETVQIIASDLRAISENANLLASIRTSVMSALNFLDDSTINENIGSSDFLFADVTKNRKVAVFLQFEEEQGKATETLFAAMIAQLFRVLTRNQSQREAVLFQIDEITNAAKIPDFEKSLSLIRSANIPTWIYLQNLSGLQKRYGVEEANMILNSSTVKICFRVDDTITPSEFVKALGKDITAFRSSSSGESTADNNPLIRTQTESTTTSYQILDVVDINDFQQLDDGIAVIMYKGFANRFGMPRYYTDYPMLSGKAILRRPDEAY